MIKDLETVPESELRDFAATLLDQDNQPLSIGVATVLKAEDRGLFWPRSPELLDTIPTSATFLRIEHRSLVVPITGVRRCTAEMQSIHFHFYF